MPLESFSQFGEDILLWEHFGRKTDGFYVEAGASHPFHQSQTWFFEQRGWRGILVEPLEWKSQRLRQERPRSQVFQAALGAPEQRGKATFYVVDSDENLSGLTPHAERAVRPCEVEVRTLDDLLAEAGNPKLDFVSLDVEGAELEVLRGFDLARHRPAVLLVEDHLQRLSVHRYLVRQRYRLVKRTGCNNWYVPTGAEFRLTSPGERLRLRKEIWLDTPVRCVRFFFKRRWAGKRPVAGAPQA